MRRHATIEIVAPADRVYAMVSDVTRYGEWSPENLGGTWLDGATGPAVGARFKAKNKRKRSWSTTSTVTVADPEREFSFAVGRKGATVWTYRLDSADGGGTTVTESVDVVHEPGAIERFLTKVATGVSWDERGDDLERGMATTLARLKAAAEAG